MKKITFIVALEFSDEISDSQCVKEIAESVADAIRYQADTAGIVPDYADAYTKSVTVSSEEFGVKEYVNII